MQYVNLGNRYVEGNVEECADEHDKREYHYEGTDDAIDELNAAGIKLSLHFLYEPCESPPPGESTEDDADVSYSHLEMMVGDDKGKLCEGCHEQEYDERI